MSAPVDGRAMLFARGWREVSEDAWEPPRGFMTEQWRSTLTTTVALQVNSAEDAMEARRNGSVAHRATAEQARSPILAACAAKGMLERDVIAELAARVHALETELRRALKMQAPTPARHPMVSCPACSAPDTRARLLELWTAAGFALCGVVLVTDGARLLLAAWGQP